MSPIATPTLEVLLSGLPVDVEGSLQVAVANVVEDSRQAGPGSIFVARAGQAVDGRTFIQDAVRKGAQAVLTDPTVGPVEGATVIRTRDVRRIAGELADRIHGRPSALIPVVGVTGTNGKSTVAHLVRALMRTAGQPCGLMGTIEIDDGLASSRATLTTPAATDVHGALARMVMHGCRAAVMEVSSHALDQERVAAVRFAGAVFTNLSGDHLDYHGDMEAYAAAKRRLFEMLDPSAWAVINLDDPTGRAFAEACPARVLGVSMATPRQAGTAIHGHVLEAGLDGVRAHFAGPWGEFETTIPMLGAHSVMNALMATAVAWSLQVDCASLIAGLQRATAPPGRLERIRTDADDEPDVFVDYAHTDDALRTAIDALRSAAPGRRLSVVFGCGGDRDRTKRARMAAVACAGADRVVITSDNPRHEDPAAIVDEIAAGAPSDPSVRVDRIVDREAAIRTAVTEAAPEDIVLIAGKGHEGDQIIGDVRRHFDDREQAEAALRARSDAAETDGL